MMLLLDAGNTSVKWGSCEAGHMVATGRFIHRDKNVHALAEHAWSELPAPAGVYIANVAGEALGALLSDWVGQQWDITPVFITSSAQACGVTNAYTIAGHLGIDRWAALVAAHHDVSGAVCVVDCGTAITVDFLAADGRHRGGLILPGVEMLQQVLQQDTAVANVSRKEEPAKLFATGTDGAINSGALYMAVAAIDRIVADMSTGQDTPADVLISGGDAGRVMTLLACPARHDPELVLKGLARLAGEKVCDM